MIIISITKNCDSRNGRIIEPHSSDLGIIVTSTRELVERAQICVLVSLNYSNQKSPQDDWVVV